MTRMTGPDCVVMCNLINTHTHTFRKQGGEQGGEQKVLRAQIRCSGSVNVRKQQQQQQQVECVPFVASDQRFS